MLMQLRWDCNGLAVVIRYSISTRNGSSLSRQMTTAARSVDGSGVVEYRVDFEEGKMREGTKR